MIEDVWLTLMAIPGFIGGVVFSALLAIGSAVFFRLVARWRTPTVAAWQPPRLILARQGFGQEA